MMAEQSIGKIVEDFFTKSTKRDWEKIAIQETQKENPLETLSWHGKDNILFLPYYDEEDFARLPIARQSFPFIPQPEHQKRTWINLPVVTAADEKSGNERSLAHLSQGAEGLLFDLTGASPVDLRQLFLNIQLPYCFTAFRLSSDADFLNSFSMFLNDSYSLSIINGALFWESIPKDGSWQPFLEDNSKHFRALGLIIPAKPPAQQVAHALLEGVRVLENMSSSYTLDRVFTSICFSLQPEGSFFEWVVTLRALRMLWLQVAGAYGQLNYKHDDLHLHAFLPAVTDGRYGPHENMLQGTFSAMAALIGGCNSITVGADEMQPQLSRWARNVSNVLREESFFGAVTDPLAGAYAVECMTESVAQSAWALFQKNVGTL
jgi:methylmalonyl-CoA mutase